MRIRALIPHLAAVSVVAGCLWLMNWQIDRAADKRVVLQQVETAPVRALDSIRPESTTPARVTGTGRFGPDRQILLDNQVHDRQPGVHVLTPWIFGEGRIILVNRGWSAWPDRSAERPDPRPPPVESVSGLLVDPPDVGLRLGDALPLEPDEWPNLMTYHEFEALQEVFGEALLPQVVQLDPDHPAHLTGTPFPVVTFGPERHLGYAFQWGLMAAVVTAIWIGLTSRALRRSRGEDAKPRKGPS